MIGRRLGPTGALARLIGASPAAAVARLGAA